MVYIKKEQCVANRLAAWQGEDNGIGIDMQTGSLLARPLLI